jgi:hypothetical protein
LVKVLVKLPKPLLSLVILSVMAGEVPVLQQTPRSVISETPSEVIFPPQTAVDYVILLTSDVVKTRTFLLSSFLQLFIKIENIPIITTRYIQILFFMILSFL